jgi:hypothetical protein
MACRAYRDSWTQSAAGPDAKITEADLKMIGPEDNMGQVDLRLEAKTKSLKKMERAVHAIERWNAKEHEVRHLPEERLYLLRGPDHGLTRGWLCVAANGWAGLDFLSWRRLLCYLRAR